MKVLLVIYDNDSYISYFPLGAAYIASALQNAGHEVTVYNQDIYHYPDAHLTAYLNDNQFDVIGIGAVGGYYQYRKVISLCSAINESKNRPLLILGGHLSSPDPEYFLKKTGADAVVIGEGDVTVVELLEAFAQQRPLASVDGIAYLENGAFFRTPERALVADVNTLPFPAWDLFPMEHYVLLREPNCLPKDRVMLVLSGRGCIFKCNFCYRLDKGFRPRSAESIIEEIEALKSRYNVTYIEFLDDLLMSSVERTVQLCESFIRAKINIKWSCEGRLNFAKPDVLKLMKEAGCVFINYGIEAVDDTALRKMNKALTVKQIITGIENTLALGISPGLNIIFGNIGETKEVLQKDVEFLLKYDDHAQLRTIRPVTPYPGSPLFYYAIEKGFLAGVEDFYENKHMNSDLLTVNFTELTDEEFYEALRQANNTLIDAYFKHRLQQACEQVDCLYLDKNTSFRGFRQT